MDGCPGATSSPAHPKTFTNSPRRSHRFPTFSSRAQASISTDCEHLGFLDFPTQRPKRPPLFCTLYIQGVVRLHTNLNLTRETIAMVRRNEHESLTTEPTTPGKLRMTIGNLSPARLSRSRVFHSPELLTLLGGRIIQDLCESVMVAWKRPRRCRVDFLSAANTIIF